jgi:hypothetical protein
MRRLLIVADSMNGGLGAVALAQAEWFSRRGWGVTVAASHFHEMKGAMDELVAVCRATSPDIATDTPWPALEGLYRAVLP